MNKPLINNQIRASQVRVIDSEGKQSGVLALAEALNMAKDRGLDLIQVTDKVEPPVCKIMEYGKYLYWLQKKEKGGPKKKSGGELKGIRLTFNISPHDLETRTILAKKFLSEGNKVRVEMILHGREKGLPDFAKGKVNLFLETLNKQIPVKVERELKREMKGFSMIITKS